MRYVNVKSSFFPFFLDSNGDLEKFLELNPPPAPILYSFSSLASTISSTPSKLLSTLTGSTHAKHDLPIPISTIAYTHIGIGSKQLKHIDYPYFPSLVFTLSTDAKLRCWDLLSSQMVDTLDLSFGSKNYSTADYGKRIKSGSNAFHFMTVVHLQKKQDETGSECLGVFLLFYSPVFSGFTLAEVTIQTSSKRIITLLIACITDFFSNSLSIVLEEEYRMSFYIWPSH